jgi:hypothetical protein
VILLPAAILSLTLVAAAATAQTEIGIDVTLSGFVFDRSTRSIRPVAGVPGASHIGAPVISGLDAAWPSPDRAHAVAVRDGRSVLLGGLRSLAPSEISASGPLLSPELVVWSPRGSAAVLYSVAEASVQLLRASDGFFLAEAPVRIGYLNLSAPALAVADGGLIAVAAGAALHFIENGRVSEGISDLGESLVGVAVCGVRTIYAGAASGIYEFKADSPVSLRLVSAAVRPADLACSAGGRQLIVVESGEPSVTVIGLDGTLHHRIPLERAASALQRLQNDSIFLLNEPDGARSVTMLAATPGSPAIFFVPGF